LVDIAGGKNHVLLEIAKEAPDGFGAKIVQDRADMIAALKLEDIP
jgi:hypothetical protein